MEANTAKKMEAIDLIRLYGLIDYQWDLRIDMIDWRGPINKLLSPETPLTLGSSFNNMLDTENFWLRLQALIQASPKSPQFSIRYHLSLPGYARCPVEDRGEVLYDGQGQAIGIRGSLKFLDEDADNTFRQNLSGYDPLTGFSEKEVVLETLTSHLEQSQQSGVPGAYLAVTIDRLTLFSCTYGLKATEVLIKEVTEAIRSAIRFNDFMGRTSGCCFGIILKDCDRWGIVRTSDRLISAVQQKKFVLEDGVEVSATISLGALVFPGESLEARKVMQRAERYLFEAQSIKGSNIAGTPYSMNTMPELKRPVENVQGKRRTRDAGLKLKENGASSVPLG
ncbi:MAG: GGDEF domain-containing protein [Caedimonas sp.]|nr:GGDEF domain-containing protein [Caedimonas sp.]